MDQSLLEIAADITDEVNITGMVVADDHGLCIIGTTADNERTAGLVSGFIQLASKLEPNETIPPAIILENQQKDCLITSDKGFTTAVFRRKPPVKSKIEK